jgi:type I restriction enzyme R subunit
VESWVQGVVTVLGENPQIRLQAAANSQQQFTESPDLSAAVTDAVLGNQESNNGIVDLYFSRPELQVELAKRLGQLVYENLRMELDA